MLQKEACLVIIVQYLFFKIFIPICFSAISFQVKILDYRNVIPTPLFVRFRHFLCLFFDNQRWRLWYVHCRRIWCRTGRNSLYGKALFTYLFGVRQKMNLLKKPNFYRAWNTAFCNLLFISICTMSEGYDNTLLQFWDKFLCKKLWIAKLRISVTMFQYPCIHFCMKIRSWIVWQKYL